MSSEPPEEIERLPQDYPATVPLPDELFIAPWEAAHWRAFGTWDYCDKLHRRSFDQGTVRLPEDTDDTHNERVRLHRLLDSGEGEVRTLLAFGRVTLTGR